MDTLAAPSRTETAESGPTWPTGHAGPRTTLLAYTSPARCPFCGLLHPDDALDSAETCRCGSDWMTAGGDPVAKLNQAEWDQILLLLQTRGGNRCELRSPACTAGPRGDLGHLTRDRVSIHHRQARKMGGTRRPRINALDNLLLICGTGVAGCHGWLENLVVRQAYDHGYLVPAPGRHVTAVTDPARVPVTLPSGRQILLHPSAPEVRTVGWAVPAPAAG